MQLKDIAEEMQQRSMAARDWVFQVLRTAIIRGVLPGGMPLRQDEISAQLSVSHIPVREAFRKLEDLNLQFHFALYEATGNTFLLQLIEQLHANVDRYIRPYYSATEVSAQSKGEHYKLLDACRAGDSEYAAAILRTHLEKTKVLSLNSPILQS